MRLVGWPAAMASRVALSQAYGSTPFNFAVWMSEVIRPQATALSSSPAKSAFFPS